MPNCVSSFHKFASAKSSTSWKCKSKLLFKLGQFRRDTRAAREMHQEIIYNSFVKQGASLDNLLPDNVGNAPKNMVAKAAI
jgi:hypothetical protein